MLSVIDKPITNLWKALVLVSLSLGFHADKLNRKHVHIEISHNLKLASYRLQIKACQYFICQIWNLSVCWVLLAKSRLVSVENVVLREVIHILVERYFLYNLGDWPTIFRICRGTFFIQRFQLCCFMIFQKYREFAGYNVNLGYRCG